MLQCLGNELIINLSADGRSRGFGFVVFRDEAACQQVLSQRNHHITPRDRVNNGTWDK